MLSLWWMLSPNFGDALGPVLARELAKDPLVAFTPKTEPHHILCGSVLNHANEHSTVWGAGLASATDEVDARARVLATRGPLSRARALEFGVAPFEAYGDPGLLVGTIWSTPSAWTAWSSGTLLVPHYIDYRTVVRWDRPVVDVLGPVHDTDGRIAGADRVASSSLHGLVAAAAHGVPFAWVSFGGTIGGDGFKYRDFFASLGMEVEEQRVEYPDDVDRLRYYEAPRQVVQDRIDAIMEVCPWR